MKKIRTIILTALLIFSSALIFSQESTLEFENAESAATIVKNYISALQKGDVSVMNEQLAPNAMIYGLGGGLDSLNVAQHKEYFTNSASEYIHSITRDLYLPIKVANNWNEGEWVLTWGTNTITNKKSGNKIIVPYHTANLIANGKIVAMRYFYDMSNIMKNSGWTLTPPKTE